MDNKHERKGFVSIINKLIQAQWSDIYLTGLSPSRCWRAIKVSLSLKSPITPLRGACLSLWTCFGTYPSFSSTSCWHNSAVPALLSRMLLLAVVLLKPQFRCISRCHKPSRPSWINAAEMYIKFQSFAMKLYMK